MKTASIRFWNALSASFHRSARSAIPTSPIPASPDTAEQTANRLSLRGEPVGASLPSGTLSAATIRAAAGTFSPWRPDRRARWPPYAPFCSDGIGLSVLPGALRLLGLAPVGCRRLTRSRVNVTAWRIILGASCVVSAPLPVLSGPPLARGHRSEGGGTFLSDPEGPPSAVRGLLAARAIHGGVFGVADEGSRSVRFARQKYSDRRGSCRREDPCKLPVPRPVYVCF